MGISTYNLIKRNLKCDNCTKEQEDFLTTIESKKLPKGWGQLKYTQEGGGHYGLPHHRYEKIFCPDCCPDADADESLLPVPEGSFEIKFKVFGE